MRKLLSAFLRTARSHRFSVATGSSLIILAILLVYPSVRGLIWKVAFVDFVVIISTAVAVISAVLKLRKSNSETNGRKSYFPPEAITVIVTAIAIFVAYASFRNQSRLAAETGLNSEGLAVLEMEMAQPNLRCLYTNFAHNDPNGCLRKLVSDADEWSAAIYYVEETLWLLEKAEEDRKAWGSVYSSDIDYWRQYVNEDPTGLFSYYLVNFNGSATAAAEGMERAAIDIKDFCSKYRRVHTALTAANANPDPVIYCP